MDHPMVGHANGCGFELGSLVATGGDWGAIAADFWRVAGICVFVVGRDVGGGDGWFGG